MKIRKPELEDLNIIIEIFRNAINIINENNIHQITILLIVSCGSKK
ncbi:hypothetical protein [Clostridium sp. JNZ J1-5]